MSWFCYCRSFLQFYILWMPSKKLFMYSLRQSFYIWNPNSIWKCNYLTLDQVHRKFCIPNGTVNFFQIKEKHNFPSQRKKDTYFLARTIKWTKEIYSATGRKILGYLSLKLTYYFSFSLFLFKANWDLF